MKVVVHDASILIDLALSECVEAWFATGIETWTSDLIYPREVDRPAQRKILDAYAAAGVLRVARTSGDAEELVREQARLGRGLSLADVSVFRLTRQLGGDTVLATGDAMLRKVAEKEQIKAAFSGFLIAWCSPRAANLPPCPMPSPAKSSNCSLPTPSAGCRATSAWQKSNSGRPINRARPKFVNT